MKLKMILKNRLFCYRVVMRNIFSHIANATPALFFIDVVLLIGLVICEYSKSGKISYGGLVMAGLMLFGAFFFTRYVWKNNRPNKAMVCFRGKMNIICGLFLCFTFVLHSMAAPGVLAATQFVQNNRFIEGKVTDKNDKYVPNLKVKIVNTATKKQYKTRTDKSGAYKFENLPLGIYTLIFEGNKEVKSKTVEKVELGLNGGIGYNISLDSK